MALGTTLVYHSFCIQSVGFYALDDKKNAVKMMNKQ